MDDGKLHARLNYWKTQLLDTSRRNRLLYFRPTPTSTIRVTEPSLPDIYERLVGKEQEWQFYPVEQGANLLDFDDEDETSALSQAARPRRTDEVRSDLPQKRLWRTLYSLRQKGRTSLQEQGVVTLFIAFGLLAWYEAPISDVLIHSPLILVPIDLLQESSKANYRIRLFEEEITLNPTLLHKMETDFGLTLPELPDSDSLDPNAYFEQVRAAICSYQRWSVDAETYIGLFSFHKLAMYKGIESHAERAISHPIVRALAGDASHLPAPSADLPAESELDHVVRPEETFQILDADSSQQQAIQAARRGVSFILQGPPGTGKSQTIANIIAECLADYNDPRNLDSGIR